MPYDYFSLTITLTLLKSDCSARSCVCMSAATSVSAFLDRWLGWLQPLQPPTAADSQDARTYQVLLRANLLYTSTFSLKIMPSMPC